MLLQMVTPPAIEPVMLSEILDQLRLDVVAPVLSSGNLQVGQWYLIVSCAANFFYAGCAPGDTFQAATATTLDANDTVQLITEGAYLATLITTARQYIEQVCGPIITQTWSQSEKHFPTEYEWWGLNRFAWSQPEDITMSSSRRRWWGRHDFPLGLPNVQAIDSITYVDSTGTLNTLPPTVYTLAGENQWHWRVIRQWGQEWPNVQLQQGNPITITFTCGYGAAISDVPEPIRQAIFLHVTNRYENRIPDPKVEEYVERAISNCLVNYRWEGF